MKISAALLADYASAREGLLFVQGGGIYNINVIGLPASIPASIALMLETSTDGLEADSPVAYEVETVIRPRGKRPIGGIRGKVVSILKAGDTVPPAVLTALAIDLRTVVVKDEGRHSIRVRVGDKTANLGFTVNVVRQVADPEEVIRVLQAAMYGPRAEVAPGHTEPTEAPAEPA